MGCISQYNYSGFYSSKAKKLQLGKKRATAAARATSSSAPSYSASRHGLKKLWPLGMLFET